MRLAWDTLHPGGARPSSASPRRCRGGRARDRVPVREVDPRLLLRLIECRGRAPRARAARRGRSPRAGRRRLALHRSRRRRRGTSSACVEAKERALSSSWIKTWRRSLPDVVDVHRHIWPEQLLEALRRRSSPPRLRGWTSACTTASTSSRRMRTGRPPHRRSGARRHRRGDRLVPADARPHRASEDEAEDVLDAYHEGIREVRRSNRWSPPTPRDGARRAARCRRLRLRGGAARPRRGRSAARRARTGVTDPLRPSGPCDRARVAVVVARRRRLHGADAGGVCVVACEGIDRWPELNVLFAILAGARRSSSSGSARGGLTSAEPSHPRSSSIRRRTDDARSSFCLATRRQRPRLRERRPLLDS